MRGVLRCVTGFALLLLLPAAAHAQATLSGLVRDTSGAVLPGVTVEASSPALIEKTRSATSDSSGRYSIPDLRPGTYRVTFTLSGFRTVVQEGIELSGTGVFTVNGDLAIGNVQETVTVTGDTPIVNLESTTRQAVMDQELVTAIPSSRTPFTVGVLIPGVRRGAFMSQDVGGSVVQEVASLEANGGRTADQRMMVNGVALSSMIAGGWGGGAVPNATGTSEFAIDVSAVDAQAATGGVRINFIPRDGGNRYSGTIFGSFAGEDFVGDNFTGSDVQARGLAAPNTIKQNGDFNPGFGGPIMRDKMWFFASGRYLFAENYVANTFHNANANNINRYDYVRSDRQAILHQDQQIIQGRLTWQVDQRNKIGVTADWENFCACTTGIGPGIGGAITSPEAGNDRRFPLQRFVTVDWNNPVSNKVLIEASGIHRVERWGGMHPQVGKAGNIDGLTPGITSVTDTNNPVTGGSLTYRSAAQFNNSWNWNIHYRAAVSYITGSHTFKVGFNNAYGHHENTTYSDPATPYSYTFTNLVPQSITYRIVPRTVEVDVTRDLGIFVQDRWNVGRWTLMGALRFDSFASKFPAQSVGPTFLAPALNISFPEQDNLNLKDVTTRLGATYDLFGNGRTALKFTLGKYLEGLGTTGGFAAIDNISDNPNPILRLNLQDSRNWNDLTHPVGDPRRGNFIPDCNLLDYTANGECAALTNAATFGATIPNITYDPDTLTGWSNRQFNWEFNTTVQHEIMPRLGVEVQYARRWYGNFRVADDNSVTAANYDRFTFVTPSDPRLPDGGGQTFTAFDLRAGAPPQHLFITLADRLGTMTEHFDGVNVTVNSRLQNGFMAQGGFGTGRQVTDDCDIMNAAPEIAQVLFNPSRVFVFGTRPLERCKQNNGWRTSVQGLAAYTVPRIDVQVSATFQNLPGVQLAANANIFPNSTTLGRGFSGGPFRVINIVNAGEVFVERLNQIDLRFSKIFRFTGTRTNINFDFYNVTNSNSVIGENAAYGPAWRNP
ncbi:MAG TPA: carboxypeptidase regulatory-like domain-containing protein, partial [Vicinamibacterales bacterium]|nr:carboxypeptidase regulatory-like domain-containing protein [Vicinamibacterales bacterium]